MSAAAQDAGLQVHLPWTLRAWNRAADPIARQLRLSADRLLAVARRRARLDDYGDPSFEEGLRALVDAYERTAGLSPLGRALVRGQLVAHLVARLEVTSFVRRFPGVRELRIDRPIVVIGLPRSGTTFLHELLAQLPGARAPALWEMSAPTPPRQGPDRRLDRALAEVRWVRRFSPGFLAAHPLEPTSPEECALLFRPTFTTEMFQAFGRIPGYLDWFATVDRRPSYRWYATALRILHAQRPGRWVLKHPGNVGALPALLEVLPDARIVHLSRDPVPAAASYCSLMARIQGLTCAAPRLDRLGDDWLRVWGPALDRLLATWDRVPTDRRVEVRYRDLAADPEGTVRRIADHLGEPLDVATVARVRRAIRERRPDRHGTHRYALSDFGVAPEAIRERTARWTDRFGG